MTTEDVRYRVEGLLGDVRQLVGEIKAGDSFDGAAVSDLMFLVDLAFNNLFHFVETKGSVELFRPSCQTNSLEEAKK